MLFVLDNDTAVDVGKVLRRAGHQCIAAYASGIADFSDDQVSVFADNHHAVVLTHDIEFIARRKSNTFGKHVQLACPQWEAAAVVKQHLDEIVALLATREAVVLKVSKEGVTIYPTQWK